MAIWSAEIKELEKLFDSIEGKFHVLEKELRSLINTGDENVVLLYSRRCLEVIITDLCECELKKPRGTEPLKGIIDKLLREEKVPSNIIASMHGLNTMSTFGTHPKDFDPEQVKPVLNNLATIIKWYLKYKDFLIVIEPKSENIKVESNHNVIPSTEKSIAVLPFVDMSPNKDQEYFCDGITEEIINALSHIEELKVIARTSAFVFKGKDEDMRAIGNKLGVAHLLEGSIRKSNNQLRVTAQLIKVEDGTHLWSEKFDRKIKDIFNIQDEISLAIVEKLKIKLVGPDHNFIGKYKLNDINIYLLYLKGNYHYQQIKASELKRAIEFYEKTIEEDPSFAPAYCGIAGAYWGLTFWGNLPPNQAYPIIIEKINQAQQIDESLDEIYYLNAVSNFSFLWNMNQAEASFRKALEINPNSQKNHSSYSIFLTCSGRHKEAILEAKKAAELDPLSSYYNAMIANAYNFAGRYDEAIQHCRSFSRSFPDHFFFSYFVGFALHGQSKLEEAIAAYEKALELSGGIQLVLANLIIACIEKGDIIKADKLFSELEALAEKTYVLPSHFYKIFRAKKDNDLAFEWFNRSIKEHDSFIPFIRIHPYEILKFPDESRYNELLQSTGLRT